MLCIRWQAFQPWNKFKSNKIKSFSSLILLLSVSLIFQSLLIFLQSTKWRAESFLNVVLIPEGAGLFLLSIIFTEPHPAQRKGRVTHSVQAKALQNGWRQSHPVLCGRVSSSVKILFLCLEGAFYVSSWSCSCTPDICFWGLLDSRWGFTKRST